MKKISKHTHRWLLHTVTPHRAQADHETPFSEEYACVWKKGLSFCANTSLSSFSLLLGQGDIFYLTGKRTKKPQTLLWPKNGLASRVYIYIKEILALMRGQRNPTALSRLESTSCNAKRCPKMVQSGSSCHVKPLFHSASTAAALSIP